MPSYCAFLGHQPSTSLAELLSALPQIEPKAWDRHIVTFETKEEVTGDLLKLLGGCVLLAAAAKAGKGDLGAEVQRVITEWRATGGGKGKITFSLRSCGLPREIVRGLYRTVKGNLRAQHIPSRYVGSEREPLAPGILTHYGIPGALGCEVVILSKDRERWIGRTIAAQDIAAYTERDMGKPSRDLRTGLLPPKLAQILLNLGSYLVALAEAKGKTPPSLPKRPLLTIWDPFAGSGVIPIECLARRWNVLASDVNRRTLKRCEQNIAWFRDHARTPKSVRSEIVVADARALPPPPHPTDCIVTETSLGPPHSGPLPSRSLPKALREAEALQIAFLSAAAASCPALPVVCTWPVYVDRDGKHHPLSKVIAMAGKLGYRFVIPKGAQPWTEGRPTLLWLRRDQWVGREIACLTPSSR